MKKNFENSLASLLVISFVLMPMSLYVRVAHAQNISGYQGRGVTGYITGLSSIITQLPLCKGFLSGKISNLFDRASNVSAPLLQDQKGLFNNTKNAEVPNAAKQSVAQNAARAVLVSDPATLEAVGNVQKDTTALKGDTKLLTENQLCLQSIARLVAKRLAQKIQQSLVVWIQSGFEGDSFFIQNYSEFFLDLGRTEILGFGTEISNPNLFPFGKDYMIRQVNYFNRRFDQNARYSLNEVIQQSTPQYTSADFRGNFTKGGWNAWLGFTQVPANNPLGFQLLASEELGARINAEVDQTNKLLQQADGFLGDQRCVDPPLLSKKKHVAALEANVQIPVIDPATGKTIGYEIQGTCKRFEYVTPGKMVALEATKILDYPDNTIFSIDDMNDLVAALLDAIIAKWTPDLIQKGFAGIGATGQDGYLQIDQDQFGYNYIPTQVESDFSAPSIRGWLRGNLHFNIRTDLTQALIDEQRIYKEKLEEENVVLADLATTARQLDYCIPGPHPGWEQDSRRILSAVENSIVSKTPTDFKNIDEDQIAGMLQAGAQIAGAVISIAISSAGTGAAIGSVVPGLGTAIGLGIGLVIGLILDIFGGPNEYDKLATYYRGVVQLHTGLHLGTTTESEEKLANKHEVTNGMDKIFDKYVDLVHKYYTPEFLPPIAKEAETEFRKIASYGQITEENEFHIASLNGVIKRLADLKERLDALNVQYAILPGTLEGPDEYEALLNPMITEFARLSEDMVTGDDIAYLDNSLKQEREQIRYVYDDLLTGPYGCEQYLQNTPLPGDKTRLLLQTERAEYPFKIWYDYNDYPENQALPLPQTIAGLAQYTNKTTSNLMPPYAIGELYGPGFLSSVYFDSSNDIGNNGNLCKPTALKPFQLDCLLIAKDVDVDPPGSFDPFGNASEEAGMGVWKVAPWYASVGRKKSDVGGDSGKNQQKDTSWEQTIYVY